MVEPVDGGRDRLMAAAAALLVLTGLLYLPILGAGFIALDDPIYVLENPHVQQGLTGDTVAWAFRSLEGANWHPLTWLSHALDWQLFGPWAGGHHLTNVVLHLVNVVLLFLAWRALTGHPWRSLGIAALFALHPLNVESVAWIAERKNVLSGTFLAATLLLYAGYARRPSALRYLAVSASIALGLLAKPMLVTLPFVLLLLDGWPLSRLRPGTLPRLVGEKLPWLAMSAASCLVTLHAQRAGGAVVTLQESPLAPRVCVAVTGSFEYLRKLAWPSPLVIYEALPAFPCAPWPVTLAVVTLALVSGAVLFLARRWPYLIVGWLWFLGMLVPVSGLVQVGAQWTASRYMYHPMVGLLVALVFGLAELSAARSFRYLPTAVVTAACLALAQRTSVELPYWRDDGTLFGRQEEVKGPDCASDQRLGAFRMQRGLRDEAVFYWQRALQECPGGARTHSRLAAALASEGRLDEAIRHFAIAVDIEPKVAALRYNLGLALWQKGRTAEARGQFREAVALDPNHAPSLEMLRLATPGGEARRE